LEMLNDFPIDSDTLGLLLVKIKPTDVRKYILFKGQEEHITVLYYYKDSKTNPNYYSFSNVNTNKNFEINSFDAGGMHNCYNIETRFKMDHYSHSSYKENTMKIKIPKTYLNNYKLEINKHSSKLKEFHLAFGKIPNIESFVQSNFNFLREKNFDIKSLTKKYVQNEGQITIITDAYDNNNNLIKDISYQDLNTLCPQNCP